MVMAAAFALLTLISVWHVGRAWPWTGALAALFFVFACLWPAALRPLNWVWLEFGLLLHKVVNPIVMALVFFGAVLPTGIVMRALGKDRCGSKGSPMLIAIGSNGSRPGSPPNP